MIPSPRHWLLGLGLSLLAAWAAGAVFLDTVQPVVFDPQVGRFVATPGSRTRTRGEGWASSEVGEHGIRGLPEGRLPAGPKVVFLGDSFVEGLQVDDAERMAQVFGALAARSGLDLCGVGVGQGGDVLADAVFRMEDYASELEPVALNVLVVNRIEDTLPGNPRPCRARFLAAPLRLEREDCPPSPLSLRLAPVFRQFELAAVFEAYRKAEALSLRLRPGPAPVPPVAQASPPPPSAQRDAAWDFLLAAVRAHANAPVLLVFLPDVPRLAGGRIRTPSPETPLVEGLARACARNGVGFLDLGPDFDRLFAQTGLLPRGFANTPPGQGHLNQDGHRLVAEAVLRYVEEHRDALLAR
jgi:lysophospholipase L1-like esterase